MIIFYSAASNAFYPETLKATYDAAGSWPTDAVIVDHDVYTEFAANEVPEGKIRIAGDDGMPAWGDVPPPTHDELVSQADNKKSQLLNDASVAISPLQDAVDLGMATDDEIAQLNAWKTYRVNVNRVDTSLAPDIIWPTPPA